MSDNTARAREAGVPDGIWSVVESQGYCDDRRELADGRKKRQDYLPLVVLAGDSGTGKSVAAAVLALEARSRGRRVTGVAPCDPEETGAYKSCTGGVWLGYYVREHVVEVGSRLLTVRWVHAPSAFDNLFLPSFWKVLEAVEMLVLDDLGLEPQTPNVKSRIIGLLVERCNRDRPTIVTTNSSLADFRATYGSGSGARLMTRLDRGWLQVGARREQP